MLHITKVFGCAGWIQSKWPMKVAHFPAAEPNVSQCTLPEYMNHVQTTKYNQPFVSEG